MDFVSFQASPAGTKESPNGRSALANQLHRTRQSTRVILIERGNHTRSGPRGIGAYLANQLTHTLEVSSRALVH